MRYRAVVTYKSIVVVEVEAKNKEQAEQEGMRKADREFDSDTTIADVDNIIVRELP